VERERGIFLVTLQYSSRWYMLSLSAYTAQVEVLWWPHSMGLELHASSYLRQTEQTVGVTMSIIFFCVSEEIIIAGKREAIHLENPAGFSEWIASLFSAQEATTSMPA
jgi:hypothetical protein